MLERRLDNAVWRSGLASSRSQARQIVLHGHVRINGKKVNIPSYLVQRRRGNRAQGKNDQNTMVLEARNVAQSQNAVPWLEIDRETFKGARGGVAEARKRADSAHHRNSSSSSCIRSSNAANCKSQISKFEIHDLNCFPRHRGEEGLNRCGKVFRNRTLGGRTRVAYR